MEITYNIKLEYIGGIYWKVLEDIPATLSNGDNIIVPKGMRTDLSSVPQWLWWLFGPYGDFLFAALVHDHLYISDYKRKELGTKAARKFADEQMLFLSNQITDQLEVNLIKWFFARIDNKIRYYAVRLFGHRVYVQ